MTETNFGWDLPPGVSQRDLDGPEDERRACGCEKDCDCLGPEPRGTLGDSVERPALDEVPCPPPLRNQARSCEQEKANVKADTHAPEVAGNGVAIPPPARPTTKEASYAWLDFQARHVKPEHIRWGELADKFGHSLLWAEGIYKEWRLARLV